MSFFGHKDLGYKVRIENTDWRGQPIPTHAYVETDWTYGAPESSYKDILFETRRKQEAIEFANFINTADLFFDLFSDVKYHKNPSETKHYLGKLDSFTTNHYHFIYNGYRWVAHGKDFLTDAISGLIEIIHRKNDRIKYLERELDSQIWDKRRYELMMMDYFIGRGNQEMDYNKSMYDNYWDFMKAIYGEDQKEYMAAHEDLCKRTTDDKCRNDYYNRIRYNH